MSDARTVITITTIGRLNIVTAADPDTGLSATCWRHRGRTRNEKEARASLDDMRAIVAREEDESA